MLLLRPCPIGKVCAWLNLAGFQAVAVWQVAQVLLNSPRWKAGSAWQPAQAAGVPLNTFLVWQAWHCTVWCFPTSGKTDLAWSKVAGFQAAAV